MESDNVFIVSNGIMIAMSFNKTGYYRETLTGLTLSDETVNTMEFEECLFNKCIFINCKFERCKFLGCIFQECTLSAVNPSNSRFINVEFSISKVIGFDWTKAIEIEGLKFSDCQVNYSNFRMLKLPGIQIVNCEAKDTDFIEADLSGGIFKHTDFENSQFFKANLSNADLRGAKNYYMDVRNTIFGKTKFSMPEVLGLLNGLDIIID